MFQDFRRGFETIHVGHGDVENDDIRFERLDGLDGLFAIGSFTADFPVRARMLQDSAHSLTNNFMIIDD